MFNETSKNFILVVVGIWGLCGGFMFGTILFKEKRVQIYLDCYGYQENCVPTPDKQVPKQVDLNINWKR